MVSWTSSFSVCVCFNAKAAFGDSRVWSLCFLCFFFVLQFPRSLVCVFVCLFLQLHFLILMLVLIFSAGGSVG